MLLTKPEFALQVVPDDSRVAARARASVFRAAPGITHTHTHTHTHHTTTHTTHTHTHIHTHTHTHTHTQYML
jgi:hypothetical protein